MHLQPGVKEVPPNALGKFLNQQRGFSDKSNGNNLLFKVDSLMDFDMAKIELKRSPQFVRCGPIFSGMLGQNAQDRLIDFFIINRIDDAEQLIAGFNWVP